MEAMQKIKCLTIEDSNFPDRLRKLSGMPKKLYYIGNLPDPKKPAAAVVGARMCSPYGRCQAFKYARTMASYGVQIISGMARGIDAEGHKGALDTDTPTFAVLGSGVDVCYPNSNRWLYQRILEKGGGIISELPPGSPPVNWAFPARNRIISGLSDAVLVVEAKEQSGSLITANFALEHGHSVYAYGVLSGSFKYARISGYVSNDLVDSAISLHKTKQRGTRKDYVKKHLAMISMTLGILYARTTGYHITDSLKMTLIKEW